MILRWNFILDHQICKIWFSGENQLIFSKLCFNLHLFHWLILLNQNNSINAFTKWYEKQQMKWFYIDNEIFNLMPEIMLKSTMMIWCHRNSVIWPTFSLWCQWRSYSIWMTSSFSLLVGVSFPCPSMLASSCIEWIW